MIGKTLRFRGISRRGRNRLQNGDTFVVTRKGTCPPQGLEGTPGDWFLASNELTWFWFSERNDPHVRVVTEVVAEVVAETVDLGDIND